MEVLPDHEIEAILQCVEAVATALEHDASAHTLSLYPFFWTMR